MRNLQLGVDIDSSCAKIATQTNDEANEMNKSLSSVEIGQLSVVKPRDISVSIEHIKSQEERMQSNARTLLKSKGIDLVALENYFFGKGVAFALCYGADLASARAIGFKQIKNINYAQLACSEHKISAFLNDPSKYTFYNDIVKSLLNDKIEKARKKAVNAWKQNLAKNMVEDGDNLKKLITHGSAHPKFGKVDTAFLNGVSPSTEFVDKLLEVAKEI